MTLRFYNEQTFSKTWAGQQIRVILAERNTVKHSLLRPTEPHPEPGSDDKAVVHKRNKSGCLKRKN